MSCSYTKIARYLPEASTTQVHETVINVFNSTGEISLKNFTNKIKVLKTCSLPAIDGLSLVWRSMLSLEYYMLFLLQVFIPLKFLRKKTVSTDKYIKMQQSSRREQKPENENAKSCSKGNNSQHAPS